MVKVFLKDLMDKRTIPKYLIMAVIFSVLASNLAEKEVAYQNLEFTLGSILVLALGLTLTIYYSIKSYTTNENTLMYYLLPVLKVKVSGSFLIAFIIDTIIRKLSLAFAVAIALGASYKFYLVALLLTPVAVVLASVPSAFNISSGTKALTVIGSLICAVAISLLSYQREMHLVSLVILVIYISASYKLYLPNTYFAASQMSRKSRFRMNNYFLKHVLSENVYLVNTFGLLAMIIIFGLAFPPTIGLPMVLMIATVNTPFMTIFSTSEDLFTYNKLLPHNYKSLEKEYFKLILGYYTLIHLIILFIYRGFISPRILILLAALVIFDTLGSFYLETKHPIRDKKTTTEVWKHPRKYILGVIAFLLAFVVINIL